MNIFKMGLRSLLYRKKQYISLFLVCMVGVGISLFCFFLIKGMLSALEDKAKIYYGGNLTFIGGKTDLSFNNAQEVIKKLEEVFPEDTIVSQRFDFDADYAAFYFEGTGVRQRIIKGIDFEKEKDLFTLFNYVEGDTTGMENSNGILLSEPIAKILGAKTGDSITFMLRTPKGTNTMDLIVKGIFRDSSLFGMYTSYMDISYLRNAYGMPQSWANRICINLPSEYNNKEQIRLYQKELEGKFNMFPLVEDKQIFYDHLLTGKFKEPTYALVKLSANLNDLQVLIDAMKIIAAFVIIMLLVIITVGVSSTYRVIAMKRINEIGIYMALGMKRHGISGIMLAETFLLLLVGCLCGFIFSLFLCWISSLLNLSFIPAFDIFLVNGVLTPLISLNLVYIISITICVTTILAVLFAVRKSVKIMPATALGTTE